MNATRDRIVGATVELFRRRGYNGTSLKQITEASEATIGSLYHFFPGGKDQLAQEVIEVSGAAYRELFELIADEAIDPVDAIRNFFDGAAEVLASTDFIDPCPIGTVAREVASVNDPLRDATRRVFESWIEAATNRFVAAGVGPEQAAALATTVVAGVEGGFVLARASHDEDVLRTIGRQMATLVAAGTTQSSMK